MTHIKTIKDFNKITKNDIELIFSKKFNQKIIIPNSVQTLTFGYKFNQKIIIPNSVQTLIFDGFQNKFNQKIIIPDSVQNLTFGQYFNQKIIIPNSVHFLNIYKNFNKNVKIPKHIKLNIF